MKRLLLVMAKQPEPGATKTRLIPPLTEEEASELYACFLEDTLNKARELSGVQAGIAYAPSYATPYFRQLAPDFLLIAQQGANLGERLASVLITAIETGYDQVVAVNSDSPTLPSSFLSRAFRQLDRVTTDVVLGPCQDGGYYLIGWKRPYPRLVREVTMSTARVLQDTIRLAFRDGLHIGLTPRWYDVDEIEQLERVRQELRRGAHLAPYTAHFLKMMAQRKREA